MIFYCLNGVSYFSQIDLKSNYYQMCVEKVDVEKMAMRTKYNSYELLVVPFGMCNASSTFTTLMNSTFHEKLNEFII